MLEGISTTPNINTTAFAGIAAPKTEVQAAEIKAERVVNTKTDNKPEPELKNPEQSRFQAVKQAAEQALRVDPYAVSDVRFTIYKALAGNESIYFTRFTSLRDGKVTVVPEQTLVGQFGKGFGTLVDGVA